MGLSKRDKKRLMREATRNAINILAKAGNPVDGAPPLEFTINGTLGIECSEIKTAFGGGLLRTIVIHAEGYPAGAIRLNIYAAGADELQLRDPQPGLDAAMAIGKACGWTDTPRRFDPFNPWRRIDDHYRPTQKGHSFDVEDPTGIEF